MTNNLSIQTGSGKSYTMMGSGAALDDSVDPGDHGLIPRICSGIFERVDQVMVCILNRVRRS